MTRLRLLTPAAPAAGLLAQRNTSEMGLARRLLDIVEEAIAAGYSVRIDHQARRPLAMGEYDHVIEVYEAKGCDGKWYGREL